MEILDKSFDSNSRARAIQIREEVYNLKKGIMQILEYMLKAKMLADELEVAGCDLSEEKNS